MDDKYTQLFSIINSTLQKQQEQKQRGINDYNMVSVVRRPTHEVGMHSNVLYSLLDPEGKHYQGRLFLDLFIEHVLKLPLKDFSDDISVVAEELTEDNRRIDFTIKSSHTCIGIEMKVNSGDSENQISDYHKHLSDENRHNNIKPQMYYLTKFGNDADPSSTNGVDVVNISFKKHILTWLKLCQEEIKNITNLNIAFDNYIEIVQGITMQHRSNIIQIEEELVNNKKELPTVLELLNKDKEIKGRILYSFFNDVIAFATARKFSLVSLKHPNKDGSHINYHSEVELKTCINWYLTNSSKKTKGIGLFIDCNFGGDFYLHIQAATNNLHIGLVKCTKDDGQWKWVALEEAYPANAIKGLKYRKWDHFPNWFSIDCGDILSMNPTTDTVKGLINLSGSSIDVTLQKLIELAPATH